jgi:glycosyltransferase involved in cell wall biosynthesis
VSLTADLPGNPFLPACGIRKRKKTLPEIVRPPLITVLVSTFNGEKYIKGCLEDLENQTLFSQLEILVIDSGSSQNEGDIVKSFQRRCPNIRYIRTEERETLSKAWNRGIQASRGRYVVNANIDDARRADAFEVLAKSLESNPEASLAYGDCAWTSKPNDAFPSENIIRTVQYPDYHPALSLFYCFTGCLQFWRKSALDDLNGFQDDLTAVGDYEILMRLVEKKGRVVHVPEVLSLFFQNTEGITQNSNRSAVEEQQVRSSFRGRLEISHFFKIGKGKS